MRLASGRLLQCDGLLYAGHRVANTDNLNLRAIGLPVDSRGRITVDDQLRTSVYGIYAAGDIIGFPRLASTAIEQGRVAASDMFGQPASYQFTTLPLGIYTIPEVGMVGQTEEQLQQSGVPYGVGTAEFSALVRGQILGDQIGMLKLLFDLDRHYLLGVHVIGTSAAEILHIGHMAMLLGGTMEFLRDAVFNFPTMAEAYKAAAADGLRRHAKSPDRA